MTIEHIAALEADLRAKAEAARGSLRTRPAITIGVTPTSAFHELASPANILALLDAHKAEVEARDKLITRLCAGTSLDNERWREVLHG